MPPHTFRTSTGAVSLSRSSIFATVENGPEQKKEQKFLASRQFKREVFVSRMVVLAIIAWLLCFLDSLNDQVESSYEFLKGTWWFQHDSFEPVCATAGFSFAILYHQVVDDYLPSQRYLINPEERVKSWTTGVPAKAGTLYLLVILGYDALFPRRKLPEVGPAGFLAVVGQVALALVVYDLMFFHIHVAMHKVKALRRLHVVHHTTRALYSIEVLRHGLVDGSLQVLTNVATLNLLKLHPYSRMVSSGFCLRPTRSHLLTCIISNGLVVYINIRQWYNIVITFLLTEAHSGFDFPWSLQNVIPLGMYGGATRHEEHHKSGNKYFQQFFTYADDYLLPHLERAFFSRKKAVPAAFDGSSN